MRVNALRGLAAVALAVMLLSSGLSSSALWSAQALVPSAQVTSGQLSLVQQDMSITLARAVRRRLMSPTRSAGRSCAPATS